ncbi:putative mediator of RNA polymerase II transcription subunit 15 [Portunus trituberculatus]|uniref:putative mediator of RNA polymerase II transcription subunit 15 n=1 Tax=Portunus trituberculatus TaxID=210409 RepID=UPI001E1CBA75|nr:putative mediator of RNA polymerase II transcription subunit 15 [Portunus trituberculatus]
MYARRWIIISLIISTTNTLTVEEKETPKEEGEEALVERVRSVLRVKAEEFLAASGRSSLSRNEEVRKGSKTPAKPPPQRVPLAAARQKRSKKCPGNPGNFGFNSFNLLTFALQVFNGVISVLNTISNNNNNDNNNNNNNNDNSGNNINSNVNEQNADVNSMTSLTVVVEQKRRKREIWKSVENIHCSQPHSEEMSQVTEDIYSAVSDMIRVSKISVECVKYVLCGYIQRTYRQHGLGSIDQRLLSDGSSLQDIYTVSRDGNCSALFPVCTEIQSTRN